MAVYKFSDAWFLLANYAQGNQKIAQIDAIIDAGDYINHARFTNEEISGAVIRSRQPHSMFLTNALHCPTLYYPN